MVEDVFGDNKYTGQMDDAYDDVVDAVTALEERRQNVHTKLEVARASFMHARRALEANYAELSFSVVPTDNIVPQCVLVHDDDKHMQLCVREPPAASPGDGAKLDLLSASSEIRQASNTLSWFSMAPPEDLRRAQAAFRDLLHSIVLCAEVQSTALDKSLRFRRLAQGESR